MLLVLMNVPHAAKVAMLLVKVPTNAPCAAKVATLMVKGSWNASAAIRGGFRIRPGKNHHAPRVRLLVPPMAPPRSTFALTAETITTIL